MAFPASPTEGQTFTENNTVWIYSAVTGQWYRSVINPLNETTYIGSDGAPGGIGGNTQVIFNDNGSLASDAGLVYNKTTDVLTTGSLRATSLGAAATPSLTFTSDPNTGIYSPGADQLAASTAGSERIRITSAGLVGIGTSAVQAGHTLQVNGIIASVTPFGAFTALQTTGGTGFRWTLANDGTCRLQKTTDGFVASTSTAIVIDASDRVGIGVTSPSSLLHLAEAGNITVGTTTGTKIGTATTQKLGFYNATPVVQPAAVANATTAVDVITQLNDLLAKLRTLGIIAT